MAQISRLKDAEISNGNLINADDIDAEFNQLVSQANTQDTELTSIGGGAYNFSGVKTFSSSPKTNGIDERTADVGVTIDSVRNKDGMVKLSGTPTEGGEIGYASNVLKYHNGTAVVDLGSTISAINSRSSNTIWAAADNGALFVCTSTFTQTFTAAATLGAKWFVDIRNDGTGVITLDPNNSETIDGVTTIKMYPGEAFRVVCDGSGFKTIGRQRGLILLSSQSASGSTTIDFTTLIDSGFDEYELHGTNIILATDAVNLWLRVSEDAGANWKSGASDYGYSVTSLNGTTTPVPESGSTGAAQILLNRNTIDNAAGTNINFEIKCFIPSSAVKHSFRYDTVFQSTNVERAMGVGRYAGTSNAINGLRILASSGNITSGDFRLYGVRK